MEGHRPSSETQDSVSFGGQNGEWTICGSKVSRTALVYLCQVVILYVSIVTCFINLTVQNGPNELWITILSLSLGTILPAPKVRKNRNNIDNNHNHSTSIV